MSFNPDGFVKDYNEVGDTQGETSGLYAAVTTNQYAPTGDPFVDAYNALDSTATVTGSSPSSDFDIGGFLVGVNNAAQGIAAVSRNVAASAKVTAQNLKSINQPPGMLDQFNAMPTTEKLAVGIVGLLVLAIIVKKLA